MIGSGPRVAQRRRIDWSAQWVVSQFHWFAWWSFERWWFGVARSRRGGWMSLLGRTARFAPDLACGSLVRLYHSIIWSCVRHRNKVRKEEQEG